MKKLEKVRVTIPKRGRGDEERFISCNGRRVLVKTGVEVELDRDIAEVYFNSLRQSAECERKIAEMAARP